MWLWRHAALLAVYGALATSALAFAEPSATLDQYRPAPRPEDGFALSSGEVGSHLQFAAQLHLDYARNPLVYENVAGDSSHGSVALVRDELRAHAALALGLFGVGLVYAEMPVDLLMQGHELGEQPTATGSGAGDFALGGRFAFYRGPRASVALQVTATFPTGASGKQGRPGVAGDGGVSGSPQIVSEIYAGPLSILLNLGARWRYDTQFFGTRFTDVLTYGAGLAVPIVPNLRALAELHGETPLDDVANRAGSPLEALLGLKLATNVGFDVGLAGGAGLLRGYGSPGARVVLALGYSTGTVKRAPPPEPAPEPTPEPQPEPIRVSADEAEAVAAPPSARADRDKDGFPDDDDPCPLAPGPADNTGCPVFLSYDEHSGELALAYAFRFTGSGDALEVVDNPALDELLAFLSVNPKFQVRIESHLSRSSDARRSMRLSNARALAVARFLIAHAIAAERLEAAGCGANRPLVAEHSSQRAKNERIAAYVVRPLPATGLRSGLGCELTELAPRAEPAPTVVVAVKPEAPKSAAPAQKPEPTPVPKPEPVPAPKPPAIATPAAVPGAPFTLVQSKSDSHKVDLASGLIELKKPIRFEEGSAELNPKSAGYVDEIAATLRANPTLKIAIESHTAAEDAFPLTQERATAIKQRLAAHGVAPERMKAYGCGDSRPIAPNNVPWGQKKNERVELHVLDPAPSTGVHSSEGCRANE